MVQMFFLTLNSLPLQAYRCMHLKPQFSHQCMEDNLHPYQARCFHLWVFNWLQQLCNCSKQTSTSCLSSSLREKGRQTYKTFLSGPRTSLDQFLVVHLNSWTFSAAQKCLQYTRASYDWLLTKASLLFWGYLQENIYSEIYTAKNWIKKATKINYLQNVMIQRQFDQ